MELSPELSIVFYGTGGNAIKLDHECGPELLNDQIVVRTLVTL
jgi:hypothetical protein